MIGMTTWGTLPNRLRESIQKSVENVLNTYCLISLCISFLLKEKKRVCTLEEVFKKRMAYLSNQEEREMLDKHHTHCILFDIGKPDKYLDDTPRSNFVEEACSRSNPEHVQVGKKYLVLLLL